MSPDGSDYNLCTVTFQQFLHLCLYNLHTIFTIINRFLNGLVSLWNNWKMSIIPTERYRIQSDLLRTVPT